MKHIKSKTAGALAISLLALASAANAQDCGSTYVVKAGDSLSQIASDVYDSAGDYQIIYSANANKIGSNPGLISVGMQLEIPCLDGEITASTANDDAIREVKTTESLPAPTVDMIRVVAGGNWAPFLSEEQAQGGMLTEIVNVALETADSNPEYRIDFINDWGAHLTPLVSDHRYDFSLAWFRPNCAIIDKLGDGSKFRCNNLSWSEPLFEQVLGYYTRVSDPVVEDYKELLGKTICRPAGYSTFMLEEHDLVEPNITMVSAETPQDCFNGLADGSIDAVALAVDTSEGVIKELGLTGRVANNQALDQVLTVHAVISNTNPNADAYLDVLDNSLLKMKSTGQWFNIVRRHLSEHRAIAGS